ncbi:MAG: hypothetical protein RL701_4765 [Pseudomonadota bacterium]|jgi:nucleotide-binding universal stress UspA family protein
MTSPNASDTLSFNTIVVGTDFQPCSQRAVNIAAGMVKASAQGQLFVVHTFEIPIYPGAEFYVVDMSTPIQEAAQKQLDECLRPLVERGVNARGIIAMGPASEQILKVAEQTRADLIVVGTHGRRGLKHAVLGSVAEKVVRLSPVPVLTVHEAPSDV